MIRQIAATIERYRMLAPGQTVAAAVSGGADSVCLLVALRQLAPLKGWRVRALHLNHGLRGAEADGDEAFVSALAARLGVELRTARWDPRQAQSANLEEAARLARLRLFEVALQGGFADRVALGHTRSDQAETVLFRLLRGSGGAGLAGIRPVTSTGLVRPLLELERADVETFLRERGETWREDSSNQSPAFARNRLRHALLPQLAREWNPAIVATLARTAGWALAEEEYWEGEMERLAPLLRPDGDGILLEAAAVSALPEAAARRLLRRAMEQVNGNARGIGFEHALQAVALASQPEGSGHALAHGLEITRSFGWLRVAPQRVRHQAAGNFAAPAPVPGTVALPGTRLAIRLELIEKAETFAPPESVYNGELGRVDWSRVSGSLHVRYWRPGDRFAARGSGGITKKLKNLFQQVRIPVWERERWPVLVDGEAIVWTRRFGADAAYAAASNAPRALLVREFAPNQESELG